MPVLNNAQINGYLQNIGKRLAASKYSGDWPFSFKGISDKNINAFALPGGPMFVNTATILAADNEAQLAGVMAHEMSHVVLRHGTNQASKKQLISLPAMLAGGMMGNGIAGALGQLGIGLAANSALLSYSRGAESQADYNGTLILADVGYNPIEMSRFFEKLEAEGSSGGGFLTAFLSDHPSPGNRVKATEQVVQQLPPRTYKEDISGQFAAIKSAVGKLPPPPTPKKPAQ